ncbi:YetF domain-containing protein, partial [Geodermatophilus sp. SYSU D00700]
MSDVWTLDVPAGEKVLRTVAVYAALALLLRVAGKRNLAHLNSFDLVVVLLLSTVVQNALIGPDDSVAGGLLAAAVLVATNAVVVRVVSRSERAVRLFEGSDVPLIRHGRFLDRSLRREGLRRADVEAALRAQGADGAGDVAEAGLGPGGSIVVWLEPARMSATRGDIDAVHRRLDAIQQAIAAATADGARRGRGALSRVLGLGGGWAPPPARAPPTPRDPGA